MKLATLIVLLSSILSCKTLDQGSQTKLVGGTPTKNPPSVMALIAFHPQSSDADFCTATLIRKNTLLTAAHCVSKKLIGSGADIRVYTGHSLFEEGGGGSELDIDKIVINPNFSAENIHKGDDTALVYVKDDLGIKPTPALKTILSDSEWKNLTLRIFGYGDDNSGRDQTYGTKRSLVTSASVVTPNLVRVGKYWEASCHGDSGGPAIAKIQGIDTVVGVISYGSGDCSRYSVLNRVDAQLSFIP